MTTPTRAPQRPVRRCHSDSGGYLDGTRYQLRFDEREHYLFAEVSAQEVDGEMARVYLAEIVAKCRELGATRLMLVRDIPMMLKTGTLYFTTQDFNNALEGITVAFVNPYESIREAMELAILIGQNAGARFRLFKTHADAERWLIFEAHILHS